MDESQDPNAGDLAFQSADASNAVEEPRDASQEAEESIAVPFSQEDTQPHDLRKVMGALAKERNAAEPLLLHFQRRRGQDIRLPLEKRVTYIGRHPDCDIILEKPDISRRHVRITKTEAGYYELMDLRATNGTLVNGVAISRMVLMPGDTFTIGGVRFNVEGQNAEMVD